MPHALLLSPDDQAVSAITGVLEEMSVTCERPLDGASAAQKINSHSFDLVLVDCENLPAAKLIFDVCRRGKNGNNPVPIAIVDGRAGLPTAFRLGAELILTKPVAKDQARSTIRTAVSRVRKDVQTNESVPPQVANAVMPSAVVTSAEMPEERMQAAAAAVSSQLTSFADPAPRFVPTAAPTAALTATLSAPALTTKMHSAVDEIDAAPDSPKLNPQSASFSASSWSDLSESSSARTASVESKPARPVKPSDDPVLAELERTELEESELAESQPAESQEQSSGLSEAAPNPPAAESGTPVFSSYPQGRQKTRGPLVALLMLVLAGGGFYAAWMYQSGFREIAQPQIDRVLALAGMALPPTSAPNPAKPSTQLAPATTSAPAPQSPTDPNQTQSTVPDSATRSATTSAAATVPVQPAATPGKAVMLSISGATTTAAPVVSKPEANKSSYTRPSDSKKDSAAATSSAAQLPGENSAIILSSKGAEKRLAHSVAPKYPVEARSGGAEGTVVLKAVIDENGQVDGLRLVEGNATLATAAIQAVKQWRYRPYVRDGKAQPFQTVVIVDFQRP
jgi:periplasmic protein TonB